MPTKLRLQWGHGDEAVEERIDNVAIFDVSACFNGATAMKPWKSLGEQGIRQTISQLQWGHGDEAVEERWSGGPDRTTRCSFNGATAMKPWKRVS